MKVGVMDRTSQTDTTYVINIRIKLVFINVSSTRIGQRRKENLEVVKVSWVHRGDYIADVLIP